MSSNMNYSTNYSASSHEESTRSTGGLPGQVTVTVPQIPGAIAKEFDLLQRPDWIEKHLQEFEQTVPEPYRSYMVWPHKRPLTPNITPGHLPPHPADQWPEVPPPFSTTNQSICHSPQCPFSTTLTNFAAMPPLKPPPFLNTNIAPDKIIDTDPANYEIRVNTSEFKPEEVKVSVADNTVTISGNTAAGAADDQGVNKSQMWNQKQFNRSYTMPSNVEVDRLTCEMDANGQLCIKAPKRRIQPAAQQTIAPVGRPVPIKVTFAR